MTPKKNQLLPPEALPAKMPTTVDELNRAICLLGNRVASDLKGKTKSELISIIGVYPTVEQASYWKQAFKKLLKEKEIVTPVSAPAPAPALPKKLLNEEIVARTPALPKKLLKQETAASASLEPVNRRAAQPAPDQLEIKHKKAQQGKRYQPKFNSTQFEFEQTYLTGVSNLAGINLAIFHDDEGEED
jgi:hypothetical protein